MSVFAQLIEKLIENGLEDAAATLQGKFRYVFDNTKSFLTGILAAFFKHKQCEVTV